MAVEVVIHFRIFLRNPALMLLWMGAVVDVDLFVIGDNHQLIAAFHEAGALRRGPASQPGIRSRVSETSSLPIPRHGSERTGPSNSWPRTH